MNKNLNSFPALMKTLLILILINQQHIQAEELPRKVILGIRMEPLTETLKEELIYNENHGVFIPEVIPGGSFAGMGVKDSVILNQINSRIVSSTAEVLDVISMIDEGQEMEVFVFKDGVTFRHTGIAIGKLRENHPLAEIIYGSVSYAGNQLRSLLYLPVRIKTPPVVFFLQGYTCQTVEMPNWNPVKKLVDDWLEAGFAVYMVEKPGIGDSRSDKPCMQIDFHEETKAFLQAYHTLLHNKQVDTKNIFLFGHSMGGVVAPLLSHEHEPRGVMVFGIMGKNWYDYMLDIFTEQRKLLGATDEEIQEALKYDQPFIHDMLINKKNNDELINNPHYGEHLQQKGIAEGLKEGYYLHRHYTFWQTLADVDIPQVWSKVKAPVYVMHGEYDIQAIGPQYSELIAKQVNEHGGKAGFELISQTGHAFLQFDSMEQNIQVRSNGTYRNALAERYNPEVAKVSIEWMRQMLEE